MPSLGINLAGAEFGENHLPGVVNRDYTWCSEATFRYFASRGFTLVRFPVLWERLQPSPGGALAGAYVDGLRRMAALAAAAGSRLIVDVHNFGRYAGSVAPAALLADLWVRLSAEFRDDTAVYAYGLMNEPHDMHPEDWRSISQEVVAAIRNAGDGKLILVPGDAWSSAARWPAVHGPDSWIFDPAGNFAYEAHLYFDRDESGRYRRSYGEELRRDPLLPAIGARRLEPFAAWCRAGGVRGFIGEFGVPGSHAGWLAVLDNFLPALDAAGFDAAWWAAGEWWGDYGLSLQPEAGFSVERPQMAVLLGRLHTST